MTIFINFHDVTIAFSMMFTPQLAREVFTEVITTCLTFPLFTVSFSVEA